MNVKSKKCGVVMENVCSTTSEEECSTEMRIVNETKGITKNNKNNQQQCLTKRNEMMISVFFLLMHLTSVKKCPRKFVVQ